ncbi:hypothetical protein [Polaromonas sp. YR568]|uniref:hypothetical protein n=1 Tax=Polaromonas sp. YR568 TaxID=1855301 RepID=UPI00398BCA00
MRPVARGLAAIAVSGFMLPAAHASGAENPIDYFVSRAQPDVRLERYEAGSLGVVLTSYPRVFLYPAWRAIVRGTPVVATPASSPDTSAMGPLDKACCDNSSEEYLSLTSPASGPNQWLAARLALAGAPPRVAPAIWRTEYSSPWTSYRNCPDPAWAAAASTLKALQSRGDATPARLQAWVAAQDAVFEFCDYVPGAAPKFAKAPVPPPEIPASLPDSEAPVWRQWREYQIASAHFYGGRLEEAEALFTKIGAQTGHPMQAWGEYLALRTSLRRLTLDTVWDAALRKLLDGQGTPEQKKIAHEVFKSHRDAWQQVQLAVLTARGNRILAKPALRPVHEPVRATLRRAAFLLTPVQRFDQLSDQLDDVQADPHANDALADWRRLANDLLDGVAPPIEAMRAKHVWFDWMRTLQGCEGTLVRSDTVNCQVENGHAVARWEAAGKAARGEAAAWLVAALATAAEPTPELVQAAERVAQTAPEYLTVQYHLVRLQRTAGQTDPARSRAESLLAKAPQSTSAVNLLRRERFAMATGLEDAARFVERRVTGQSNPDTGQTRPSSAAEEPFAQIDEDGDRWLNERLSAAELLKLSELGTLSRPLRISLATAAWWRADLLGKPALANTAAERSAALLPRLGSLAKNYVAEADPQDKRHLLVMASLTDSLSPLVSAMPMVARSNSAQPRDDVTASAWCGIGPQASGNAAARSLREPNGPQPQADSAQEVAAEMATLRKIPPATSFVGAHVLKRLELRPADPDLPWLLYVTVQSTRGGCVGRDNETLSRTAHAKLHLLYKKSEWAQKAPYWYK